jgi:HlyD family secretion protein
VTSRQTDLENAQKDFDKYSDRASDDPTRKYYEDALRTAQVNYDTAVIKVLDLNNSRDLVLAAHDSAVAAEAEAKRNYENTLDGPDKDKLAQAQAQLELAMAQLALAQSALDNYDLKAPFDGTVADVNIAADQTISPSVWAVALVDNSKIYVDTSDLSEMDVVKINIGQEVQITADSLPGVSMDGVVEMINTAPTLQGGDVLYTVHILLKNPDPRLLWGMTMEVTFTK